MYLIGIFAVLIVGGGVFGFLRAKRTAASESSPNYRRAGFSGD